MNDLHHPPEGHRDRLRSRYLADPDSFSQAELLELLLTFAIPRRDVASLAVSLLDHFGDLAAVLSAPVSELVQVDGIGEATAIFLQAVRAANSATGSAEESDPADLMRRSKSGNSQSPQLPLFSSADQPANGSVPTGTPAASATWTEEAQPRTMRVFTNDEVARSSYFQRPSITPAWKISSASSSPNYRITPKPPACAGRVIFSTVSIQPGRSIPR